VFHEFFVPRPAFPVGERNAFGPRDVLLEDALLRRRECPVVDVRFASSFRRNERGSKFVEPTETRSPSTIITLQWYIVGWYS